MNKLSQIQKAITIFASVRMNPIDCEFKEPVNYEGNPPSEAEVWNWKILECDLQERGITQISDGDYTAYISSKVNLADIFIMGFLIIILGAVVFKFIWDFINPKIVKYKKDI